MTPPDWNDPTEYRWKLTNEMTFAVWLRWVASPPPDEHRGPARRLLTAVGRFATIAVVLVVDLWINVVLPSAVLLYLMGKAAQSRPDVERHAFWVLVAILVYVPVSFGLVHLWARRRGRPAGRAWHRDFNAVGLVAFAFGAAAYLIASDRLPFRTGFTGPVESWRAWAWFYTDMTLNTALFGLPQVVFGKMTDIAPASVAAKAAVAVFKGLVILLFINRLKKTLTGFAGAAETELVATVRKLHEHLTGLPLGASNPRVQRVGVMTPVDEPGLSARQWLEQYRGLAPYKPGPF